MKVTVVIETPRHCIGKYFFDDEKQVYRLRKMLPLGMSFPYDFGLVKHTVAEDHDPIDAIVITECNTFPGVQMDCRVIGAMLAKQGSAENKKIRNDRFVFIPDDSIIFGHIKDISDLSKEYNRHLEEFFINYNKAEEKKFVPLKWVGAAKAEKLLEKQLK